MKNTTYCAIVYYLQNKSKNFTDLKRNAYEIISDDATAITMVDFELHSARNYAYQGDADKSLK